ncbi:MAG: MmgE/PrpD family protein [Lapillicoccus sp.]
MSASGADHEHRLQRLVAWALGPDVLLADDQPHAVTLVTDTLAAVLAAGVEPEVGGLAASAPTLGGVGPATVLATGVGTSPYAAALVNGTAAVRLELDEGNGFCANHPSAHTLPAVLATAEAVGADGMSLLAASVAAYEVAVRVGRGIALRPVVHPFGTAMVCGAALGVARLRGLDVALATRAVRLAAALVPASTQRAANQGATVRNAVTGSCAAAGVLAVTLAETGTSDDALALPTVFGEILGESYDDRWLDEGLGAERYLRTGYLKLHACSRWNHAPIEATEAILTRDAVRPEDVVDVEVATYDPATRLDGREPQTGFAGKHSIPFNVAARILLRDNGIDTYTDEVVRRPELRALMQRVRVVEDPTMTAGAPQVRAARVTIRLHDGRVLTATEERPPGGADRPYAQDVVRDKHQALLRRGRSDPEAEALLRWCDALPQHTSLAGLAALVGGAR